MILKLTNATIAQPGKPILTGLDLSLHAGEFSYLVGKTGSGKSSLLKTIYGALPLAGGTGEAAGFDLGRLDRRSVPMLRRKLGIVFQDFALLTDRTVFENLTFVLRATGWKNRAEIESRATEVLHDVGLLDKKTAMPFELSGGEQSRASMARALLNRPLLLLADEPTGNLDPETSDDILILLRNLAKNHNTTVLCATHDYRILQNFPARILRIQSGRLLDDRS